jgi:hypothetical protein
MVFIDANVMVPVLVNVVVVHADTCLIAQKVKLTHGSGSVWPSAVTFNRLQKETKKSASIMEHRAFIVNALTRD